MPRVHIDSVTVDYCEAGSGFPIIFIPGITEFKEAFSLQLRGLSDSYRVISYDQRRALKRTSDYTLDLLVSDLHRFMNALRLGNAVICGHSFGGLVAMQFAKEHPGEASALVLVSAFPAPPAVPDDRFLGWISSARRPLHKTLGARFKVGLSRLLGKEISGSLSMQDEFVAIGSAARQAAKTARLMVNQRMNIIRTTDLRPILPEIQAPTLVVVGSKDKGFLLTSAQEIYNNVNDSSLEVIEGGGHFCFLTHHDQFNSAVDDFIAERLPEMC